VPKHVEVDTYHELYFILLTEFVGWYIKYKKMDGMSNKKFTILRYNVVFDCGLNAVPFVSVMQLKIKIIPLKFMEDSLRGRLLA
jgi:hypothetical protein